MKTILRILVAAFTLIGTPALAGSPERLGTGGGDEMRMAVGVRSIGLGGSTWAASPAPRRCSTTRPASRWRAPHRSDVHYSRLIADMDLNYVALSQKMGNVGTLGLSVKALSIGDIERRWRARPTARRDLLADIRRDRPDVRPRAHRPCHVWRHTCPT
jgi:hypothetical protein